MPKIVIDEADCNSATVEIERPVVTIGRVFGNDIVLNHGAVSRQHAVLHIHRDEATITDLSSLNGVYVNGVRIDQSRAVGTKDIIRIVDYAISLPSMNSVSTEPHSALPSQEHRPAGVLSSIVQVVRREFTPRAEPKSADTITHVKLPTPTTSSLRKLLLAIFTSDSDFDAFCLDHFPRIKLKFSNTMDRTAKTNLLLESAPSDVLLSNLSKHFSEDVAQHERLIRFEGGDAR